MAILDEEKNNLVHICAAKGHVELLKYILEKNPQADLKNLHGFTPLDLTVNEKIKELLNDYLKKNSNQYHKVTIHNSSDKSANNLLNKLSSLYNSSQKNLEGILNSNKYDDNSKKTNLCFNPSALTLDMSNTNRVTLTSRNFGDQMKIHESSYFGQGGSDISSIDNKSNSENDSTNTPLSQDDDRVGPASFLCHALLGRGSFGEVYLVEKKSNKTLYAMKILSKNKIMCKFFVVKS